MLMEMIATLWKSLPVQGLTLSGDTETILGDRLDILEAIRAGHADQAFTLMANHVGHAADRTKEYLAKVRRQ
jgi:DNA-binding FadR family transcriptional regulator